MEPTTNNKKRHAWKLPLGLLIGAVAVGIAWALWWYLTPPTETPVEKTVEQEVTKEVPVETETEAEEPAPEEPASETEGWLTKDWGDYSFMYPPDWTLEPNYYQTPAQEAEGQPPELIGYYLIYQGDLGDNLYIQLGGRQADCVVLQGAPRCTDDPFHVHTPSSNSEVLRVYDLFINTISHN